MSYDALEYLMEVHYLALVELFVFAFAIYFAKSWIDYWFQKRLRKYEQEKERESKDKR
jgi:type III secretory pathway component EscU